MIVVWTVLSSQASLDLVICLVVLPGSLVQCLLEVFRLVRLVRLSRVVVLHLEARLRQVLVVLLPILLVLLLPSVLLVQHLPVQNLPVCTVL